MAPSRVPHFGGKSFEPTIGGLAACLPAHAPWWVRMARHGAPPQRPSRLSQACWCVFPWRSGQFDRVIFHAESWSYVAGWAGRSSQLSWRLLGRLVGCWVVRLSGGRAEASSVTLCLHGRMWC
ncbi:unnamed protein product [Lupinus luteus]|uniref:Uncharacterized protein n=1 Tax=Lupinus luteus TaxID=3873 RepID=A0AAV1VYU1_LUPLU